MKWYIMNCWSGREISAKNKLNEDVQLKELQELITEIIVPTTTETVKLKNGQLKEKHRILFPGYIIIKMDWNSPKTQFIIASQKDIKGFIGADKTKPLPISQEEIDKMLGLKEPKRETTQILLGKRKVLNGLFKNFDCEVIEVNGDKASIKTNAFGREIKIDINVSDLLP